MQMPLEDADGEGAVQWPRLEEGTHEHSAAGVLLAGAGGITGSHHPGECALLGEGRQRDFEDEVVANLTLWCGDQTKWNTKKKVIETFKNSPMWTSWMTAGYNEQKLVNLINRLKIKHLEDGHNNHNGGGASEFEPLKPEFLEMPTNDAEGALRRHREPEHSSQDAALTAERAAENGDEDRRASARIRAPRHKAPPTGLFSTVFFQHGDATESLRIGGRTLRRVHADPNIFLIDGFLTEFEMQHLDCLISPATFAKSYTDAEDGTKVVPIVCVCVCVVCLCVCVSVCLCVCVCVI
jgi:hypothetical protein